MDQFSTPGEIVLSPEASDALEKRMAIVEARVAAEGLAALSQREERRQQARARLARNAYAPTRRLATAS